MAMMMRATVARKWKWPTSGVWMNPEMGFEPENCDSEEDDAN
jgi:hypothetical protein